MESFVEAFLISHLLAVALGIFLVRMWQIIVEE